MRAMDVMTSNVITVSPDTSVQEVAKILSERGISGVLVVDAANRLVGIGWQAGRDRKPGQPCASVGGRGKSAGRQDRHR